MAGKTIYAGDDIRSITGEFTGDVDHNGNYALGLQNIPDLNANGQGYHFDGTAAEINLAENDNLKFGAHDFTIIAEIEPLAVDGSRIILSSYDDIDNRWDFRIINSVLFFFMEVGASTLISNSFSTLVPTIDIKQTVALIGIRGTGLNCYHNDTLESLSYTDLDSFDVDSIVNVGHLNSASWFSGNYSKLLQFNMALSYEEYRKIKNGAPVPYKYLGASQDEIVTNGDFATNDFTGWTASAGWDASTGVAVATVGTSLHQDNVFELGKQYRLIFDFTLTGGSLEVYIGTGQNLGLVTGNGSKTYDFVCTDIGASNRLLFYGGGNFTGTIDNVSVTQIGCVLQLEQPGIGHNQWLDNSGNELHGEVSGAIPTNLPVNHIEKVIKKTITGDTLWTDIIPIGYILERIIFEETAGNAGILDLGTSDGANDVFTNVTINASDITIIEINKMFSKSLTQTLDLNDDQAGSSWNSASIDITLLMRRIQL